ncbi:dihydropteroate synthase [Fluoribacter gormanii]|uniref:Dihydropteroate synthase n=1 Tax=Fluoribacter gormanii TaxID=464 RepID=A0A377GF83_9GAMM|nr:dihydropteroate synthase [Fluoribacter gormanii]KTD04567.1 Dihydropteroate synthase [Fluoribacter gormanii]SIR31971.1 Dihydropteroate synthase [Fluoribacter gormanii]STO23428.1 Dihydropteroate synthase [Fluoribacter gormanii]
MNPTQFSGWLERQCQPSPDNSFQKPLIMGILNVTPDSFSDGGKFLSMDMACKHAYRLVSQGADLIDIGGQSTRPGAQHVPLDEELERVIPVIEQIRANSDICISIDTNKPEVMAAAVSAGANVINDIYALRTEGALEMAAELAVPVCLMHMQGEPHNMQHHPYYSDGVLSEVTRFFMERIAECEREGIKRNNIILDPGFGFGKQVQDNLLLVKNLDSFASFGMPLLLGVSRKSTIGTVLAKEVGERLIGSIATAVYAALNGVGIIRTHDVDETSQALHMIAMISQADVNQLTQSKIRDRGG